MKTTRTVYFKQHVKLCFFLSWSLIKLQLILCNTFILKFEQMYLREMRVDMT